MKKNITVSIDEQTYRCARIRAAELDTSVSALVQGYLRSLAPGGTVDNGQTVASGSERRRRMLTEVIEDIHVASPDFKAADNLPREELHERG